jgi:UDPglucose 6-dehydrogenase
MNIAVIGTGYVGLVTGVCLAETGNTVTCIDIDNEKISRLQQGIPTIYENGLEKILHNNISQKRLFFTTDYQPVSDADLVFLALPTPSSEDGSVDMRYFMKAAADVAPFMKGYTIIINKSTVPVGTADKMRALLSTLTDEPFDVVSNPEFLREGMAIEDFLKPDRIVIGSSSQKAIDIMNELYAPYVRQGNPILVMDEKSAELTKYGANAFLATKITFMNEMARLCEKVDANIDMVRLGMGTDERIGRRFLFAGIGYGGSCFPKDVKGLRHISKEAGYEFRILKAVDEVNAEQRIVLLPKIKTYFQGNLRGRKIAVWGIAFKPNTDDIREAPAIYMIRELLTAGADICAYDPEAMDNARKLLGDAILYASDPIACLEGADALFIATEWPVFRTPDFDKMAVLMKQKVIFDGRNLYSLKTMKEHGYHYFSIGREDII